MDFPTIYTYAKPDMAEPPSAEHNSTGVAADK